MEPRRLRELILDQAEARDIKPERLIALIEMPSAYFEALINHQPEKLPAYPYMLSYLEKIADALNIERAEVIAAYKQEFSEKVSGAFDRLPANRYALPTNKRRYIIGGAVGGLILIIYIISQSGFFGTPELELTTPPLSPSPFVVETPVIDVAGTIEPGDTLFINGSQVPVESNGAFIRPYTLSPELNSLEIVVKRFLGKEIRLVRQVYYQESEEAARARTASSTDDGTSIESSSTDEAAPAL